MFLRIKIDEQEVVLNNDINKINKKMNNDKKINMNLLLNKNQFQY